MSIEVASKVRCYEVNGSEPVRIADAPYVLVESHWNRNNMVVLTIGREKVTVLGADLEAAIHNAKNVGPR